MTPSERKRRIEAAAKRRYESYDTGYQWEAAGQVTRAYYCEGAAADLDAADEAVPVVSEAEMQRRSRIDHEAAAREHEGIET